MTVATPAAPRRPGSALFRRHTDLGLALAMGGLVGLLIFALPMQAALSTAVVGAFVLIMLVDTRVALLGLLLVRASVDVFATVPLLSAGGGINPNAFDGRGNYNLGIKEQLIFPEITYDMVDKVRGMDVTVVTTARTDEEARALLQAMGFPFRKQ